MTDKPDQPNEGDPAAGYRDEKGRFIVGVPQIGGRKPGSFDGIKLLRKLISKHAEEMSMDEGEIDQLFREMRKQGKQGTLWMLQKIFDPLLRSQEREVQEQGPGSFTVIMVKEEPEKKSE